MLGLRPSRGTLTDDVKRDGNHIGHQIHTDCTSTIADLTAANKSLIDALQVKFLRDMTDQIKERYYQPTLGREFLCERSFKYDRLLEQSKCT